MKITKEDIKKYGTEEEKKLLESRPFEKIWGIILYEDGGPNDRGEVVGYINAPTASKALSIYFYENNTKNGMGFYDARPINRNRLKDERDELQNKINEIDKVL